MRQPRKITNRKKYNPDGTYREVPDITPESTKLKDLILSVLREQPPAVRTLLNQVIGELPKDPNLTLLERCKNAIEAVKNTDLFVYNALCTRMKGDTDDEPPT